MNLTTYGFLAILLFGSELLYLQLARHFHLFDVPNERSLHQDTTTVRGGGIVVYLAVLTIVLTGSFDQPYFFGGLTAVVLISFLDDLYSVPIPYRLFVQALGVGLLLVQTGTYPTAWWVFPGLLILGICILNTGNFMDGINGMTAFYSLVTVGTLWYLQNVTASGSSALYPSVFMALLVFGFFNARPKAICFAGDVGSIGIAFILLYSLLTLINQYHTYLPLLLLAVYGTDSLLTIIHRANQQQLIFRAHRQHLFQLLVSKRGWSHLRVSCLYALVQAGINGLVIWAIDWPATQQFLLAGFILIPLLVLYITLKRPLMIQ